MKKTLSAVSLLALTVFSLPALGGKEDSQYSQPGGTAKAPPIDLLIPQEAETATFALG